MAVPLAIGANGSKRAYFLHNAGTAQAHRRFAPAAAPPVPGPEIGPRAEPREAPGPRPVGASPWHTCVTVMVMVSRRADPGGREARETRSVKQATNDTVIVMPEAEGASDFTRWAKQLQRNSLTRACAVLTTRTAFTCEAEAQGPV